MIKYQSRLSIHYLDKVAQQADISSKTLPIKVEKVLYEVLNRLSEQKRDLKERFELNKTESQIFTAIVFWELLAFNLVAIALEARCYLVNL